MHEQVRRLPEERNEIFADSLIVQYWGRLLKERTHLDISVNQLCRVQVFQSTQKLIHEVSDMVDLKRLARTNNLVKIAFKIVLV